MNKQRAIRFVLRLPPDLHERVKSEAARNMRSHLLECLKGDIDVRTRECYAEKSKG